MIRRPEHRGGRLENAANLRGPSTPSRGAMRQTNPICAVFGLKTGLGEKTKPIGRARPRQIRNPKLETRNRPKTQMLQTANAATSGCGIRDTLHEIRDTRGSRGEPQCGQNAKQTQFAPSGYMADACGWARGRRLGIRGCPMRETRFEVQGTRQSCGQNVKQSRSATFGYIGVSSVRGSRYQIRDARYASTVWTARQTKPISPFSWLKTGVGRKNKANLTRRCGRPASPVGSHQCEHQATRTGLRSRP
jgi:hypothetical protein